MSSVPFLKSLSLEQKAIHCCAFLWTIKHFILLEYENKEIFLKLFIVCGGKGKGETQCYIKCNTIKIPLSRIKGKKCQTYADMLQPFPAMLMFPFERNIFQRKAKQQTKKQINQACGHSCNKAMIFTAYIKEQRLIVRIT